MPGDEEAKRLLKRGLQEEPVVAAWLFGSAARGERGPLSDVDVALLPEEGIGPRERLGLLSRVAAAAEQAWRADHCDVVYIDEAPVEVAFEAVHGELLLDRDPGTRVVKEARILSTYHDRRHYADRRRRLNAERWQKGDFA